MSHFGLNTGMRKVVLVKIASVYNSTEGSGPGLN